MTQGVVELAGPAGAGKSTLAGVLPTIGVPCRLGVVTGRPRLALALLRVLPMLVAARTTSRGRWWTVAELRSIAYVGAWRRALAAGAADGLVVLDHGPVFRLAALDAWGPPMVRSAAFRRWWGAACGRWASVLTLVVWLDAADDVLVRRIVERDRAHRVRDAADGEAAAFLGLYRGAFRRVLDRITGPGRTRLLELDSSRGTPEELAAAVCTALSAAPTRAGA